MHSEDYMSVKVGRGNLEDASNEVESVVPGDNTKTLDLAYEIANEVARARQLFPPHHSLHEALGIVQEEFDEFKDEVYAHNLTKGRDRRPAARVELIQLAAMAMRTILDVIDSAGSRDEAGLVK